MPTTNLQITGMTCGHCVKAVQAALTGQPGVSSATVDLGSGRAQVEHTDPAVVDRLIAAVEEEGYQAKIAAPRAG